MKMQKIKKKTQKHSKIMVIEMSNDLLDILSSFFLTFPRNIKIKKTNDPNVNIINIISIVAKRAIAENKEFVLFEE